MFTGGRVADPNQVFLPAFDPDPDSVFKFVRIWFSNFSRSRSGFSPDSDRILEQKKSTEMVLKVIYLKKT